jgi:type II secretory pathway component PulJ
MLMRHASGFRQAQSGLSIVELMVGVAVGLIVVAAATVMVSGQLSENRRLIIETQLQQDLRATADIIIRDLRRMGALPEERISSTPGILETLAPATASTAAARNVYYGNYVGVPPFALSGTASAREVVINYSASDVAATHIPGPYGFRLASGVMQSRLPGNVARWQDLTDPKVMKVTRFSVDLSSPASLASEVIPCPNLCPGGDTACWPRVVVRELAVVIEAEAASDASVKRAVTGRVRLRNDEIAMNVNSAVTPPAFEVCPP